MPVFKSQFQSENSKTGIKSHTNKRQLTTREARLGVQKWQAALSTELSIDMIGQVLSVQAVRVLY